MRLFCNVVTSRSSCAVSLIKVIDHVPEIRVSQARFQSAPAPSASKPPEKPSSSEVSEVRKFLLSRGNSAVADRGFHFLVVLCGLSLFGIVGFIPWQFMRRSELALAK